MFRMGTDEDMIAQLITRDHVKGLLKQAVIGPNEVAIIIRNGKIEDVVSQTKLTGLRRRLSDWVATKLGGGEDYQLLFVDTSPRDLEFAVGKPKDLSDEDARLYGYSEMLSKDYEPVAGTCTARIQISPENAMRIIDLMKGREEELKRVEKKGWFGRKKEVTESAGRVLRHSDLEYRIQGELISTVFSPQITEVNASEFRGNLPLVRDIETAASVELRKTFDMWGLNLLRLYTVWEQGAFDELMSYRREVDQAEQRKDIDHGTVLTEMRRGHETAKTEQEQRWALSFGEADGQERLKTIASEGDVLREGMIWDEGTRQFRTRTGAELEAVRERKQIDVDMDRQERDIAIEAEERLQAAKRERIKLEQDFKSDQMAVQTGSTERIMSEALKTGAADSEALKEMMRQQSMQKMADREVEKVEALSEAEKARYDIDTFKAAEDREREQQVKVMGKTAEIMEASKQDLPRTLVQGKEAGPAVTVPVVARSEPDEEKAGVCPNCGEDVKPTWQVCPNCSSPLHGPGQACPDCGTVLEPGWKVCPNCGRSVG